MSESNPIPNRAGVICFNRAGQILLVGVLDKPANHPSWVLPKGHIESGEDLWETAQREAAEEAGIIAIIESTDPIFTNTYDYLGEKVTVAWFAAQAVGFTPQTDVRPVRWAHWRAALDLLKFPDLKQAIRVALCMKQEG